MAKVGKFYKVGCNEYFVSEKITRECWGGANQVTLRLVRIQPAETKFSITPDFGLTNELPEPAFDRVAVEVK